MEMKTRQIVEVSKLPNGKYVLCVISVVPRSMTYYHTQSGPHKSYRWMREDDWCAFDRAIESLAFEMNYGEAIKKSVYLTPLVHLKIQSVTLSVDQLCQINPDIKDLKVKNIAMAVKCEIQYDEKSFNEPKAKHLNNTVILSDELLAPYFKEKDVASCAIKKTLTALKLGNDLDQQIQSFHIRHKDIDCLTPISSVTVNTSTSSLASKLDINSIQQSCKDGYSAKRVKTTYVCEDVYATPPIRQRRIIHKPKRFHEFVMQAKRNSYISKTKFSDIDFSDQLINPKHSQLISETKTSKACEITHRNNMQKLVENLTVPSPPREKLLSLKDLTVQQIMNSLNDIKPRLDGLFKDVCQKDYVQSYEGINHFLVIELISDKIKNKMMKKLGELYEKSETPKFGSHFINVLMPEWILCLFMKRFKMKRNDAIKQLKAQNLRHSYLCS